MPIQLYIETSVLRQLPSEVATAEFKQLKELAELLNAGLWLPRLALDEWIQSYVERMQGHMAGIVDRMGDINRLVTNKLPAHEFKNVIDECKRTLETNISDAGIKVIDTPQVDVNELIRMSLKNIPPFEVKGEKGFRDAIILTTILEHAKTPSGQMAVFLTDDSGYDKPQVEQRFVAQKTGLIIVRSVSEAHQYLESLIKDAVKRYRARLEEDWMGVLHPYVEPIADFVEKHFECSLAFLTSRLFGSLKEIKVVEVLGIHTIVAEELPNGIEAGEIKVSFMVKLKVTFVTEQFEILQPPKVRFYQPGTAPTILGGLGSFGGGKLETEDTVEKDVPAEGRIYKEADGSYKDFKIDRLLTY